MKITKELFQSKGACSSAVEKFASLFPRGVTLTEALCVKHVRDFDFTWAAQHLLSPTQRAEYERVRGLAFYNATIKKKGG